MDALFVFALSEGFCDFIPVPGMLPGDFLQLHVSLDNGASFTSLNAIAPALSYSPSHEYRFVVTGQGQPAAFSYADDVPENNYGHLRIAVNALPEPLLAVPTLTISLLLALAGGLPLLGCRKLSR